MSTQCEELALEELATVNGAGGLVPEALVLDEDLTLEEMRTVNGGIGDLQRQRSENLGHDPFVMRPPSTAGWGECVGSLASGMVYCTPSMTGRVVEAA